MKFFPLLQGGSPYERDTYRYTPLLSWLLLPNVYLHELWGKCLFTVCDIIGGWLIYELVRAEHGDRATALFCSQIWLYNPLTLTISSRGNAESVMVVLVLLSLHCIISASRKSRILGYLVFGLAVHTKIYPVTYSLPIYLFLEKYNKERSNNNTIISTIYRHFWPNFERIILVILFCCVIVISTGTFYMM